MTAPLFGLALPVPIKDVPAQRTQAFKMALRLQARSIETDFNVLVLEIVWDGQWADDTEDMTKHLVFSVL